MKKSRQSIVPTRSEALPGRDLSPLTLAVYRQAQTDGDGHDAGLCEKTPAQQSVVAKPAAGVAPGQLSEQLPAAGPEAST